MTAEQEQTARDVLWKTFEEAEASAPPTPKAERKRRQKSNPPGQPAELAIPSGENVAPVEPAAKSGTAPAPAPKEDKKELGTARSAKQQSRQQRLDQLKADYRAEKITAVEYYRERDKIRAEP
jgi:hypothetical protein